ncbi:MAG: hypothetical protein WBF17_18270, partial [Phycisphaerae bacterium]
MACRKIDGPITLVVAVILTTPGTVLAATDVWKKAVSGSFGDGTRWVDGTAPTAGDSAQFSAIGTYEALFDYDPVNQGLLLQGSGVDVTFYDDGGSRAYNLTAPGGTQDVEVIDGAALTLGMVGAPMRLSVGDELKVDTGGTLDVVEGSRASTVTLVVGTGGGGGGEVTVSGVDSRLTASGSDHYLGGGGSRGELVFDDSATGDITGSLMLGGKLTVNSEGILTVESGATLSLEDLEAGTSGLSGQSGTVTVRGAGSQITQTGASRLVLGDASNSVGKLHVDSDGVFSTGTGRTTVAATGLIEINGGTFNANGEVRIAGGTLTRSSLGTFAPAGGTTVTVSGGGMAKFEGDYVLDVPATIEVTGGGSELDTTGGVGITGEGQIDVTDNGLLCPPGALDVGTGDSNGTLTVSGGGDV